MIKLICWKNKFRDCIFRFFYGGGYFLMNPFKFVLYDIKRLFGHGKTAFIAMFSPIPVILMFGLFFAPLLIDKGESFYSIATLNDDDDRIGQLMNLILNYENTTGNITIYPVKEKETGEKLVDEGKVAIFLYVPQNTYLDIIDTGFSYSDHNPVELKFRLK